MSKADKLLAKMRNNPRDWRLDELRTVATKFGFKERDAKGSHVVFGHASLAMALTVPAKRPIKPIYIRKLIEMIDLLEET